MSNYRIVCEHYREFFKLSTIIKNIYFREVLRAAVRNNIRCSKGEKKIHKMEEKLNELALVNKSLANYNKDWQDTHHIAKLTAKQLAIQMPLNASKKSVSYPPYVFDIIHQYCNHPIALDQEIYKRIVINNNRLATYTPAINPDLMEYILPIDLYKP